jgi:plastocyanin
VRRALVVALTVALLAPAGAGAGVRPVTMPGNFFSPQRINIVVGDQVRWTNHSLQTHDVKDVSHGIPLFHQSVAPHQTITTPPGTFTTEETVNYICTLHANMKGTIGVWDLWLGTPVTIVAGNAAKFSGLAVSDGRTVRMETAATSDPGTPVGGAASVGSTGAWAVSIGGLPPGFYRARDSAGGVSRDVRLVVKPRLTFQKKRLRPGVWRITTTLAPTQAGGKAVLDKRSRHGWAKVAAKTVGPTSKAIFQAKVTGGRMTFRLRLAKPVNGYAATASPAFTLKR